MTYVGEVRDGVVVFDGGAAPPEGTRVSVQPVEAAPDPSPPQDDRLPPIGDLAVETGVPDLGRNIDHYLYGHPRQGEEQERGDGT